MSEPLFEEAKDATGTDPDQIAFDAITAGEELDSPEPEQVYPENMETEAETDSDVASPPYPALTAQDRCDSCSAAAAVRMTKLEETRDLQLLFCAHHGKKNFDALNDGGWLVTA